MMEEAIAARKNWKTPEQGRLKPKRMTLRDLRDVGNLVQGITGAAGAAQDETSCCAIEVDTERMVRPP